MNNPDPSATPGLASTALERTRWPYLGTLAFALLALPAFALDLPLARYLRDIQLPGDLRDLVRIAEVFAHGWGVLFIVTTVAVLAPQLRHRLPRVIACAAGSGLTALLLKWTIARQRPHTCDLQGSVWSTFHGLSPWLSGERITQLSGHQLESFPSGHTATAVGLAIGLSLLLPRGRWLFAFFALLAGLQRMDSGAHFLSDTLVATAVACLISGLCIDRRAGGRWFDRQEKQASGR
ncbi:MAG: phosphatase PAP2 family protein [Pirellulaceae bacterium]|nr:phosphatase PAP2 family protein [Pirellulaceae bacterium]